MARSSINPRPSGAFAKALVEPLHSIPPCLWSSSTPQIYEDIDVVLASSADPLPAILISSLPFPANQDGTRRTHRNTSGDVSLAPDATNGEPYGHLRTALQFQLQYELEGYPDGAAFLGKTSAISMHWTFPRGRKQILDTIAEYRDIAKMGFNIRQFAFLPRFWSYIESITKFLDLEFDAVSNDHEPPPRDSHNIEVRPPLFNRISLLMPTCPTREEMDRQDPQMVWHPIVPVPLSETGSLPVSASPLPPISSESEPSPAQSFRDSPQPVDDSGERTRLDTTALPTLTSLARERHSGHPPSANLIRKRALQDDAADMLTSRPRRRSRSRHEEDRHQRHRQQESSYTKSRHRSHSSRHSRSRSPSREQQNIPRPSYSSDRSRRDRVSTHTHRSHSGVRPMRSDEVLSRTSRPMNIAMPRHVPPSLTVNTVSRAPILISVSNLNQEKARELLTYIRDQNALEAVCQPLSIHLKTDHAVFWIESQLTLKFPGIELTDSNGYHWHKSIDPNFQMAIAQKLVTCLSTSTGGHSGSTHLADLTQLIVYNPKQAYCPTDTQVPFNAAFENIESLLNNTSLTRSDYTLLVRDFCNKLVKGVPEFTEPVYQRFRALLRERHFPIPIPDHHLPHLSGEEYWIAFKKAVIAAQFVQCNEVSSGWLSYPPPYADILSGRLRGLTASQKEASRLYWSHADKRSRMEEHPPNKKARTDSAVAAATSTEPQRSTTTDAKSQPLAKPLPQNWAELVRQPVDLPEGYTSSAGSTCWTCGHYPHKEDGPCPFALHPGSNHEEKQWYASIMGRKWLLRGWPFLPTARTKEGSFAHRLDSSTLRAWVPVKPKGKPMHSITLFSELEDVILHETQERHLSLPTPTTPTSVATLRSDQPPIQPLPGTIRLVHVANMDDALPHEGTTPSGTSPTTTTTTYKVSRLDVSEPVRESCTHGTSQATLTPHTTVDVSHPTSRTEVFLTDETLDIHSSSITSVILDCFIQVPSNVRHAVKALIDTGAEHLSSISSRLHFKLQGIRTLPCNHKICSFTTKACVTCLGIIETFITLSDTLVSTTFKTKFQIMDFEEEEYDILIALPDIRRRKLTKTFEHAFQLHPRCFSSVAVHGEQNQSLTPLDDNMFTITYHDTPDGYVNTVNSSGEQHGVRRTTSKPTEQHSAPYEIITAAEQAVIVSNRLGHTHDKYNPCLANCPAYNSALIVEEIPLPSLANSLSDRTPVLELVPPAIQAGTTCLQQARNEPSPFDVHNIIRHIRASQPTDANVTYARLPSSHFFPPMSQAEETVKEHNGISDAPFRSDTDTTDPSEYLRASVCFDDQVHVLAMRKIIEKYASVFRTTLSATPAAVTPLSLEVNETQWFTVKNALRARPQSAAKLDALRTQVNKLLANNVIRPATKARAWSQILMVPKPNGDYRMCLDVRALNNATKSHEQWPLPRIADLLRKVGNTGAKYFAKLDMTNGFWQMALSESSKKYTAFTTEDGTYEFTRIVMGLQSASSHFQKAMVNEVLNGLILKMCLIYIDDLFIFGRTPEELLERTSIILQRLQDKNVSVHPDKCKFGLTEAEFLGHLISEDGMGMSKEKIQTVLDTQQPTTVTEMRHFLGLCNYFRDHIDHHSDITRPLWQLTLDKNKPGGKAKHAPLTWTTEALNAFKLINERIANLPMLHFMDDDVTNNPLYLHTDASDYGIGGYLFQKKNGKECPLAFLSKTLSAEQQRWSANEKEAYAIYYTLIHFEHLLGRIPFTLRTDHKNLVYISTDTSPKVIRWKVYISEFNFTLEYIAGPDNVVGDFWSRVRRLIMEDVNHTCSPSRFFAFIGDPSYDIAYDSHEYYLSGSEVKVRKIKTCTSPTSLEQVTMIKESHLCSHPSPNNKTALELSQEHEDARSRIRSKIKQARMDLKEIQNVYEQLETDIKISQSLHIYADLTVMETTKQFPPDISNLITALDETSSLLSQKEKEYTNLLTQLTLFEYKDSIKEIHNAFIGHHGVERTMQKLIESLTAKNEPLWPNMREHVREFIRTCPCCQKNNTLMELIRMSHFTTHTYEPWYTINIDTIGPLQESSEGYKHILVIIDCFSRFVELIPIKDTSAKAARDALLGIIGRYGVPNQIRSDNGTQFTATDIKWLCTTIGTEQVHTKAYSKQENAIVERANKEVMRHLRALIHDTKLKDDWHDYLPLVQRIMNTSYHSSIGTSPAKIIFGDSNRLDNSFVLPHGSRTLEGVHIDVSLQAWADRMRVKQNRLIKRAIDLLSTHNKDVVANENQVNTHFPVGSYVLKAPHDSKMGRRAKNKLRTFYSGPFKVIRQSEDTVFVQSLIDSTITPVISADLKFYANAPEIHDIDPAEVARSDDQEWVVEKILEHECSNPKNISSYQFKVRWAGFTEESDLWLPWSDDPGDPGSGLHNNEIVHKYLIDNNLVKVLPRQYRPPTSRKRRRTSIK